MCVIHTYIYICTYVSYFFRLEVKFELKFKEGFVLFLTPMYILRLHLYICMFVYSESALPGKYI